MFTETQIKAFENLKTPFYFYDIDLLTRTLDKLKSVSEKTAFKIHYAVKANAQPKILKLISSYGFGADCVSGNEIKAALQNGFSHDKIAFAGVGKTDEEIELAIQNEIFSLNCESYPELEIIQQIAEKANKKAKIALRINPNLNPNTHHYITTGLEENKFGINMWELEKLISDLRSFKYLELTGLHFHLGSQITDLSVFRSLCMKVNFIQNQLLKKQIKLPHLNLGGGLGIDYHKPDEHLIPNFELYFNIFRKFLEPIPGQSVHFEPGRAITGQCGSLISRVLFVKKGVTTDFAILDAGMTELIRPALYQAFHKIENINAKDPGSMKKYDVVGPICESSDCFGKSVELPETRRGDLIAVRSAGAYGEVMSSSYNLRDKAGSYFSDEI